MNYRKKRILKVIISILVLGLITIFGIQTHSKTRNKFSDLSQFNSSSVLVNIDTLKLIYCSNVCIYKKPKIVLLIHSHVTNMYGRNIIRQSSPRDLFQKFNMQLIFLVAVSESLPQGNRFKLENEFRKHEDLVQGEFIEAYRNLTFKHLMGLRWVRDFCSTATTIIKMDDDIVVNYYKLLEILNKFKGKFDLLGHKIDRMKPIRNNFHKWYVSRSEFPATEYPTFLSGWMYIMTTESAKLILKVSDGVPFFWIDDVFVTGILREKAELELMDISRHFRYEPKTVECCILNKYSCDFLAAPNGKDFKLNVKLMNHLWDCRYRKRCFLESNKEKSCWSSIGSFLVKGNWTVSRIDSS